MRDDTIDRMEATTTMLVESLTQLVDASYADMPKDFTREDELTAWLLALFVEFRVVAELLDLDPSDAADQIDERITGGLCAHVTGD